MFNISDPVVTMSNHTQTQGNTSSIHRHERKPPKNSKVTAEELKRQ
jgi:hypothetical protein